MIGQIIAGIVRHVLTVLGGGLVTQGWLENEQLTTGIGAILTLGAIGWSVWQKARTRTEPGGAYNPKAEVRKGYRCPGNGGAVRVPEAASLLLVAAWLLGFALLILPSCAQPRAAAAFPGVAGGQPPRIVWRQPVDDRPFLVRLLASVRALPRTGGTYGTNGIYLPGILLTGGTDF